MIIAVHLNSRLVVRSILKVVGFFMVLGVLARSRKVDRMMHLHGLVRCSDHCGPQPSGEDEACGHQDGPEHG